MEGTASPQGSLDYLRDEHQIFLSSLALEETRGDQSKERAISAKQAWMKAG